jgi:hypothetical protein
MKKRQSSVRGVAREHYGSPSYCHVVSKCTSQVTVSMQNYQYRALSYDSTRCSPRCISGDTWVARNADVGYTLLDVCRLRIRASSNDVIIARPLVLLHFLQPTKRSELFGGRGGGSEGYKRAIISVCHYGTAARCRWLKHRHKLF